MMKNCKFLMALMLMALPAVGGAKASDRVLPQEVAQLNDSLKRIYAPDRRVELFDVDYSLADHHVMLRGVTTSPEAKRSRARGRWGALPMSRCVTFAQRGTSPLR